MPSEHAAALLVCLAAGSSCNARERLQCLRRSAPGDGQSRRRRVHVALATHLRTNARRVGPGIVPTQEQGGWKKLHMVRRYAMSRPIGERDRIPTSLAGTLKRRAS
jgi:hypothetical protein